MTLSGWNYRKSHIITSGTTLTNYQTKIRVYFGSGTDSSNSTYLNSKCNSDFSDIRFTTSDGDTLISYWIESISISNYADIWIKVPSIATTTIYIYYGRSSATSISSGDNTFELFDDFNGTTLDNAKWTSNNLTATLSSSIATIYGDNLSSWGWLQTILTYPQGYSLISRLQFQGRNSSNNDGGIAGFRTSQGGELVQIMYYNDASSSDFRAISNTLGGSASYDSNADTSYHIYEVLRTTTPSCICYIDGTLAQNGTISTVNACSNSSLSVNFETKGGNSYGLNLDWVAVRKCNAIEPTHSTWGPEESFIVGPQPSLNIIQNNNILYITNTSEGNIDEYLLEFGDGTTSFIPTTTHIYNKAGNYTITLYVSNQTINASISYNINIILTLPISSFTVTTIKSNEPAEYKFNNTSYITTYEMGEYIIDYLWNFGDGQTSELKSPHHIYALHGTYTVTLTIYTNLGQIVTSSYTLTVGAPPKLSLHQNVYTSSTIPFTIQTYGAIYPTDIPYTISWNFGDGYISTQDFPSHTYTTLNNYTITTTLSNAYGSVTHNINVYLTYMMREFTEYLLFSDLDSNIDIYNYQEVIEFTTHTIPAIIYTETLPFINEDRKTYTGYDEIGQTVINDDVNELGYIILDDINSDEIGNNIIQYPTYSGFTEIEVVDEVILYTENIAFEVNVDEYPT